MTLVVWEFICTPVEHARYMPRSVTLWAEAGGVGKTTFAVNIAAALARRGNRVLAIDLDSQNASMTEWLGYGDLISDDTYTNVAERLIDSDLGLEELAVETGDVDLIPAHEDLATFEKRVTGESAPMFFLREEIEKMADTYDYFIVDAPASRGLLSDNAIVATRNVLTPMTMGHKGVESIRGIESTIDAMEKGLNRGPIDIDLKLLGVVPNMAGKLPSLESAAREHLKSEGTLLVPVKIRRRGVLEKAWHRHMSIFEYADDPALDFKSYEEDLPEKFDKLAQLITGEWDPEAELLEGEPAVTEGVN